MFNIGDKVMRVGSNNPNQSNIAHEYKGAKPQFGVVYVVSDCWMTSIGAQCMLVGFGLAPIVRGYKTGWMCKYFRRLAEIKAENARKNIRKGAKS